MKKLNPVYNSRYVVLLLVIFLFNSCSSLFYGSKRSSNNSIIVESNINDYTVQFPLENKSYGYYTKGIKSTDNTAKIELPKLTKKYLTISIEKPNYDTQSLKVKKTVRGGALIMDIGLSLFTFGIPLLIDPFRSDFYKIQPTSKNLFVDMKYSQSFLDEEYNKIKDGDRISDFYDYNSKYPESNYKKQVLAKIDSLEFKRASLSQNIATLTDFVKKNSNSKYLENAQTQIDSLELQIEILKYNIEGIQQFISSHPNSKFIEKAKNAINDFKEIDSAYEGAKKLNTLVAYRSFNNKYPNSKYQAETKKAIASMIETGTFEIKDGVMYKGDFKTTIDDKRIKHGKGILISPNGWKYDGTWNEDNLTYGIFYDEKGKKIYDGEWKKGEYSGKGKLTPRKGELAGYKLDGHFLNGKANGFGTLFKPDSTIEYEGYWKDGRYDGNGTFYLNGKKSYVGEFKNGQPEGKGTAYSQDGKIESEGEVKNWKLNGYAKWYKNGKLYYEGYLTDDKPNGQGIMYYENGKKEYEGYFANGQPNGSGTSYKKNGQKEAEGLFVAGVFKPENSNSTLTNNNPCKAKGNGTISELKKCSSYQSFLDWICGWEATFTKELNGIRTFKNFDNRSSRAISILEKYGNYKEYGYSNNYSGPMRSWVNIIATSKDLSKQEVETLVDLFDEAYDRCSKVYSSVINMN